ncbi:LuxR C-terminal-related transcriptional regulator [Sphingomonas nostoxanthinifaciens]|uniref:LuxR C-terminal-related transcriptional regulator n=1 Tax=Sphingomonas nostoxanthinifaciens TaxID=2872652 RepID=UPI0021D80B7A|nr:response regulator transcription factor [Sphingomonas nostoxanthinifaciens]UAK25762.1 response regulator transcription factor [Sphingomonas nostoxanthinifaciens]
MVREGLAAILRHAATSSTILHAGDIGSAIYAAESADIDVVFLDLVMPGATGMDALTDFGSRFPSVPIIVFSASESVADVHGALAAGALGYLPKSASPTTISAALDLVLAGEIYVPPLVVRAAGNPAPAAAGGAQALTVRQRAVLDLIGAGLSNKEIARRLGLSEKTVKAHSSAIFRTLNVSGRAMAARIARGD